MQQKETLLQISQLGGKVTNPAVTWSCRLAGSVAPCHSDMWNSLHKVCWPSQFWLWRREQWWAVMDATEQPGVISSPGCCSLWIKVQVFRNHSVLKVLAIALMHPFPLSISLGMTRRALQWFTCPRKGHLSCFPLITEVINKGSLAFRKPPPPKSAKQIKSTSSLLFSKESHMIKGESEVLVLGSFSV